MKNEDKNIIGYQIRSSDGDNRVPDEWFTSRDVLATDTLAIKWMSSHSNGHPEDWKMVPVYEGDVKDPKMWFHF